jgi:hypothetical protein
MHAAVGKAKSPTKRTRVTSVSWPAISAMRKWASRPGAAIAMSAARRVDAVPRTCMRELMPKAIGRRRPCVHRCLPQASQ